MDIKLEDDSEEPSKLENNVTKPHVSSMDNVPNILQQNLLTSRNEANRHSFSTTCSEETLVNTHEENSAGIVPNFSYTSQNIFF